MFWLQRCLKGSQGLGAHPVEPCPRWFQLNNCLRVRWLSMWNFLRERKEFTFSAVYSPASFSTAFWFICQTGAIGLWEGVFAWVSSTAVKPYLGFSKLMQNISLCKAQIQSHSQTSLISTLRSTVSHMFIVTEPQKKLEVWVYTLTEHLHIPSSTFCAQYFP